MNVTRESRSEEETERFAAGLAAGARAAGGPTAAPLPPQNEEWKAENL